MSNARSKLLLLSKAPSTLPTNSSGLVWTKNIFGVKPRFSNSFGVVWTRLSKRVNRYFLVQWEEVFYLRGIT